MLQEMRKNHDACLAENAGFWHLQPIQAAKRKAMKKYCWLFQVITHVTPGQNNVPITQASQHQNYT